MNLIQSFTYPNLLVSECGRVFYALDMKEIKRTKNHQLTTRGYVIIYKRMVGNKVKTAAISLLNLVYETHVKKAPISNTDIVDCIDGDEFNPVASNLRSGGKKRVKSKIKDTVQDESYTWMNGHDELYL